MILYSFLSFTEIVFTFSEGDYRENEMPNAMMPVRVMKHDVLLANPVWIRVTPLTIQKAMDRNIIPDFEPEDMLSPNRASKISLKKI